MPHHDSLRPPPSPPTDVFGGQLIFFVLPIHPTVMVGVGVYTAYHLVEDHAGIIKTSSWPWQPSAGYHDDHHKWRAAHRIPGREFSRAGHTPVRLGTFHTRLRRYFHCNFGQHVLWFDWIFGTLRNVGRAYGEDTFGGKGSADARPDEPRPKVA